MGTKERKGKKTRTEATRGRLDDQWWSDEKEIDGWLNGDTPPEFETEENYLAPPTPADSGLKRRLEQIRESHSLLQQFTPRELKILMALKRNTSPKAWTLREDLVVLTVPMSNREIAAILKDRNKEAVKKRLQLLRSKGLTKRQPPPAPPDPSG